MQEHEIDKQANREAVFAVLLALSYFAWWYITAYGFAPPINDTAMPTLYFGLPLWFLLSCVVGPIVFTILCALMVKFFYHNVPLNSQQDTHYE